MIIKQGIKLNNIDKYLKTNTAKYVIVFLAICIVFFGIFCWLFYGTYNITVEGNADVVKGRPSYLAVASEDYDKIKIGMLVHIGNKRGKITNITNKYYTYEQIKYIYGNSFSKFSNISEDESYYMVVADIDDESTGIKQYVIVISQVSPFEYYLKGGIRNER